MRFALRSILPLRSDKWYCVFKNLHFFNPISSAIVDEHDVIWNIHRSVENNLQSSHITKREAVSGGHSRDTSNVLDWDELNEFIKLDLRLKVMWTDFNILKHYNNSHPGNGKALINTMTHDEVKRLRKVNNDLDILSSNWKPNLFIGIADGFQVGDPIGDSPVNIFRGITNITADRMKESGICKAYELLGQLLVLQLDTELFIGWLQLDFGMAEKDARDCYNDVNEWINLTIFQ